MRLLIDVHDMPWELAWDITTSVFNYTNHTLLPEALETWPVSLMESLLPRHMQIIYLINALHLDAQRAEGTDDDGFLSSISLIEEDHSRRVRMGHLAFLGSRRVNGVSALHTELMRKTVFRDLHSLYPERIVNKTNGITFRRWLFQANPGLTELIVDAIGPQVLDDARLLEALEPLADDAAFRERFEAVRRANKVALARLVAEQLGVGLDPDALFDVHIKRIHEYKRQLLNILDTIALYNAMRAQPTLPWVPRVKIFAGKAAAGYQQAKLIIKLANDVAHIVNRDPVVRGRLKVVFLPNYNVSLAETIIPAADLSEQISTAGMEASGTGNMKLALNGALTIGTLDGANIEIRERVGAGEHADLRAHRRRSRRAAPGRHRRDRDHRRVARAGRGARRPRRRRVLARRSQSLPRASSTACGTTTTSWSPRISTPTGRRSARSARSGWIAAHGGGRRSSTPRGWAGSPRTGRFSSMRATSGAPSPAGH